MCKMKHLLCLIFKGDLYAIVLLHSLPISQSSLSDINVCELCKTHLLLLLAHLCFPPFPLRASQPYIGRNRRNRIQTHKKALFGKQISICLRTCVSQPLSNINHYWPISLELFLVCLKWIMKCITGELFRCLVCLRLHNTLWSRAIIKF